MTFLKIESNNFLKIIKNTKTKTTYQTYKIVLEQAIGNIEIENNHLSIIKYRMKIASQNRKTISKKVSILRSFFKFLENKGYNFRIIGDDEISVPKAFPKSISIENIKKALKIADLSEYTGIITIFGLGVRVSEAINILLTDIKKDSIKIIGVKSKDREIPIEKHIKDTINKYIEIYNPKKYLFEKNGVKMNERQLRYIIKKPFIKIGIKMTPTQLRNSLANEMLKKGAKINNVSELLGYEFISTTEIYSKLDSATKLKNYLKAHPLCFHHF